MPDPLPHILAGLITLTTLCGGFHGTLQKANHSLEGRQEEGQNSTGLP